MTSRSKFLKHTFAGGWATDYGPTASVSIDNANRVQIPWLNEAQNCVYELDGGPHKAPGCSLNTAALESGAAIMGVFDAWFSGTAGTPTQHRIMHIGTKIKKDNADDTFTDLFTGMTSGAMPCYTMFEDLLVMSNDSGSDVPKSWDGTTAQNLAGTPPTFAFSVVHKNRMWAAGAIGAPSRLYYTPLLNPADWVGAGSGNIDIDPADNDRITGLVSFRGDLFVFKGPYRGSIHRITGSAPTGDDSFARIPFVDRLGVVNHASIVPYANDVAFAWSDGSIRGLATTTNFGDFEQASLSREIKTWIRDHVNLPALRFAKAVNFADRDLLLFALPIDVSTSNNVILAMDYRFDPPRFSPWTSFNMISSLGSAVSLAASKQRTVIAGGSDGKLRTLGSVDRIIDVSTSISYNVQTPFMDYGVPQLMKTLEGASVTLNPKTAGSFTFGWTRDDATQQTVSLGQGGTSVLGVFLLGTDVLGGGKFKDVFSRLGEEGGEFRTVQFQVLDNVSGQDIEMHGIGAEITPSAESYEQ